MSEAKVIKVIKVIKVTKGVDGNDVTLFVHRPVNSKGPLPGILPPPRQRYDHPRGRRTRLRPLAD